MGPLVLIQSDLVSHIHITIQTIPLLAAVIWRVNSQLTSKFSFNYEPGCAESTHTWPKKIESIQNLQTCTHSHIH